MRLLLSCARFIHGSRSLASMLPPLLLSALLVLVVTAVTLQTRNVPAAAFFAAWLEGALVAWPFAFPLVYLFSAHRPKPLAETRTRDARPAFPHYRLQASK